jgi:CBS domain-containing membrane protein
MQIFRPLLAGAHFPDRLAASIGAVVGIALTIVVCSQLPLASGDLPLIVAPVGASAVLAFAVPASPLAQPWSMPRWPLDARSAARSWPCRCCAACIRPAARRL